MLKRSFLLNLFLVLVTLFVLLFIFFQSLNAITKHGQESIVPKVEGQKLGKAMKALDGFELQIDSIYLPYKDPLEIIYQEPKAGSKVKNGRIIFLTVNKTCPPMVAMPELVNMSFRNAVLTLQSYRLIMGDTIYQADIAAGAVLAQQFNGIQIKSGTMLPIGSKINLVVGTGLSDSTMDVPDMIGKTYGEIKTLLSGMGVTSNIVWEGAITDSNTAIVFNQFPESKSELDFVNSIAPGDMIDIRIMQHPSAELLKQNQAGSAKFLDPNDTGAVVNDGSMIPIKTEPKTKSETEKMVDEIVNDAKKASDKKIASDAKKAADAKNNTPADNKNGTSTVKDAANKTEKTSVADKAKQKPVDAKIPPKKKVEVKDVNKNSNENEYK
jgi:eukaryotic-like serine/threonine-protein kinase